MQNIIVEKKEHVGIITLNNTKSLNALSTGFMREIDDAVTRTAQDKDIYVLIITGAGKAFIAGADIKEMLDLSATQMLDWARLGGDLNKKIESLDIPVIAAINGFALGGGCELAMACDIRIASPKARFGLPEVGLGITPGAGGTQRLPRLVGEGRAKELLYTAKIIDAHQAEKIGLVNMVVAEEALLDAALEMAGQIVKQGQIAVQQCKRAVNTGMQCDINSALALELQGFCVCCASEDKRIGMQAFVDKSEKKFVNR